jgi:DtxR family Mn-dependent transcriptional regulator
MMDSNERRPSSTIDDYLQTIYSLETEGEKVISARLARWRRVTPPTAWATVQRMQRDGMVEIDDRKAIRLTPRGRELAESIARRHRLSERFLSDVLGLGWAEAHTEAHEFEHGMTPVIEERIMKLLNNPTTCPHGSPIPGTGAILDPAWRPLETLAAGECGRIRFISEELEEDLDLLHYLEQHNLKPGFEVTVIERVPSTGVVMLESDGVDSSLSLQVAARIRVEDVP